VKSVERYSRWRIISFFAMVVALFLSSAVFEQLRTRQIDALSNEIPDNALPSIAHLGAARAEVRHVEALATNYANAEPDRRAVVLGQLTIAEMKVDEEADAYLRLPLFPGERELWENIRAAFSTVDDAVGRIRALSAVGDISRAKASVPAVRVACDRTSELLDDAIELNERAASAIAKRVPELRRRSLDISLALDGISVAMSIGIALVALRAARHYTNELFAKGRFLERQAAELDLFAGRVAHDVRTPLTATSLSLDLLDRSTFEPNGAAIARGRRSLRRAFIVLDALLEFARAGARPAPDACANVRPVIDGLLDELGPLAERAGVELRCEPFAPCAVACSSGILVTVLSNLTQNAIKYLEGDVRVVRLRVLPQAERVRFEVIDTGTGIPAELHASIFEPFVRGPHLSQEGTGLGLATVKRICEAHGGHVGVESAEGRGSCFWFDLPRRSAPCPSALPTDETTRT